MLFYDTITYNISSSVEFSMELLNTLALAVSMQYSLAADSLYKPPTQCIKIRTSYADVEGIP